MEKDITQDLCISHDENQTADDTDGSASVSKDNTMEMIFSTASTSNVENGAASPGDAETEEAIVRLLQSGESISPRSPSGQPLPVQEASVPVESSAPLVPKTFLYQPQEILDILETMKRVGFTAYLEVVPIHHKRYHIQLQSNESSFPFA